jgi:hypothetical protein
VTTDLDIFMATWADITQIDAADLASLARQEFGRIRGPLFSDVSSGYSWAFSDGTVSQVEGEILRIATVVMAALGEAGLDSDRSWIASRLEVLGLTESVTK